MEKVQAQTHPGRTRSLILGTTLLGLLTLAGPAVGTASYPAAGQYASATWHLATQTVEIYVEPAGVQPPGCAGSPNRLLGLPSLLVRVTYSSPGDQPCQVVTLLSGFVEDPSLGFASLNTSTSTFGNITAYWQGQGTIYVTSAATASGSGNFVSRYASATGTIGSTPLPASANDETPPGGPPTLAEGLITYASANPDGH